MGPLRLQGATVHIIFCHALQTADRFMAARERETPIVNALMEYLEAGGERLDTLRRSVVTLTLCVAMVDGGDDTEKMLDDVWVYFSKHPLFRDLHPPGSGPAQVSPLMLLTHDCISSLDDPTETLDRLAASIPVPFRLMVFAIVTDFAFSDGRAMRLEVFVLKRIEDRMGIPPDLVEQIQTVMALRAGRVVGERA